MVREDGFDLYFVGLRLAEPTQPIGAPGQGIRQIGVGRAMLSRDFALREVPEPELRPGTIKVRVSYAGICGSDLHIYLGFEPGLPQGVHGHEFSGMVAQVGKGVAGFAPGDRVTVEITPYDLTRGRIVWLHK